MKWKSVKEFLKPTKWKIIIFIVFSIFFNPFVIECSWLFATSSGDIWVCNSNFLSFTYPVEEPLSTFLFFFFLLSEEMKIKLVDFRYSVLIFNYILACLLVWAYDIIREWKKTGRKVKILVLFALITIILLPLMISKSEERPSIEEMEKEVACTWGGVAISGPTFCNGYLWGAVENTGKVGLGEISLQVLYTNMTSQIIELCFSGNKIDRCDAGITANFFLVPGKAGKFNTSIGGSNYDTIVVMTNCTDLAGIKDAVKSTEITRVC